MRKSLGTPILPVNKQANSGPARNQKCKLGKKEGIKMFKKVERDIRSGITCNGVI